MREHFTAFCIGGGFGIVAMVLVLAMDAFSRVGCS